MLYDFETNITELENVREREARNEVISNNYLSLIHNSHLLQQIGEKPISMDSFLDVCNILLEPEAISIDKLHSEVEKVLKQSIEKVKSSFDYIDLQNYNLKELTYRCQEVFSNFCIDVSNATLKYNQYSMPTAMPVVFLQSILKSKGFDFDLYYVSESFKQANDKYNTIGESGEEYIKNVFSKGLFNIIENNEIIEYDLDNEYQKLHNYCNLYMMNKGTDKCESSNMFFSRLFTFDPKGVLPSYQVLTNDYFKYYFDKCEFGSKKGTIRILDATNKKSRIEGLIEFTNQATGDKEYIFSNNLLRNLRIKADDTDSIQLITDQYNFKVNTYESFEDYIIKNNRIDFDIYSNNIKPGFSYNLGQINLPEALIEKSDNLAHKTYNITQCYIKENEGIRNCHLVIKDESENYYLLKNVEEGVKLKSIKKDKDFKLSNIINEKDPNKRYISFNLSADKIDMFFKSRTEPISDIKKEMEKYGFSYQQGVGYYTDADLEPEEYAYIIQEVRKNVPNSEKIIEHIEATEGMNEWDLTMYAVPGYVEVEKEVEYINPATEKIKKNNKLSEAQLLVANMKVRHGELDKELLINKKFDYRGEEYTILDLEQIENTSKNIATLKKSSTDEIISVFDFASEKNFKLEGVVAPNIFKEQYKMNNSEKIKN